MVLGSANNKKNVPGVFMEPLSTGADTTAHSVTHIIRNGHAHAHAHRFSVDDGARDLWTVSVCHGLEEINR